MNNEEMSKVLEINGEESTIFLPNEYFSDLQGYLVDSSHVAYAYSYLYLTHFLYRNCKYFNVQKLLDGNLIKEILGYSKSNRTMNYITKRGGLLDEIGYTKSTKDYPISWHFEEGVHDELSFYMASELKEYMVNVLPLVPKMFFLKYPVKAFERVLRFEVEGQIEEEEIIGTFYDVTNTHTVHIEVFIFCMSKEDLGATAFYLYSWLKHRNDVFGGYDVPISKLAEETGVSRRAIIKYMDLLKGYRMISFKYNQEYFVAGMYEEDRKATTYYTNEFDSFLKEPQPYKKMGVQSRDEYFEIKAVQEMIAKGTDKKVDIPLSDLPF